MVPENEEEDDLAAMGFAAKAPESAEPAVRAEPDVAAEEEEAEEEEAEGEYVDPPMQPAPTPPPAPSAAPPAPPPAAPAEAPAPATPPEPSGVIVVDVEPSPGALKFLGTVSEVGEKVSSLEATDVSDGMMELSKRCTKDCKESWLTFKDHAFDLAITATSDAPGDQGRLRRAAQQAEWRKLAGLPLAAMYCVFAMCCLCAFAVIYYPKMYAPALYNKCKTKFLEYGVDQKAIAAAAIAKSKAKLAYDTAANSEIAAKSAETIGTAYTTVVTHPTVAATASRVGEVTDDLRSKLASKLVEIKGGRAEVAAPNGAV